MEEQSSTPFPFPGFWKFIAGFMSWQIPDDYIRDMKINSELNYLLTLLMNESWHPAEKHRDAELKKQNVLPVKQYLDEHYQEKISLDFLAEHFFISKYYLTRVFREQFGVSISSYLMNRRVTKAKYMLRFSDEKIKIIGYNAVWGASLFQPGFQTDGRHESFRVQREVGEVRKESKIM